MTTVFSLKSPRSLSLSHGSSVRTSLALLFNRKAPEPQTKEPEVPPLPKELEEAVLLAFKGSRAAWMDTLKDQEQVHPDHRGGFGVPHPRILELLVEAMKVKVPAVPQWTPVVTPLTSVADTSKPRAETVPA